MNNELERFNRPRYVMGIDPSFAHLGLSIIDMKCGELCTYDLEVSLGKQDFWNVCKKSKEQVNNVGSTLHNKDVIRFSSGCITDINPEEFVLGMENALPYGYTAAPLTALDVLLYYTMTTERTALFNPSYLGFHMGKHTKKDSIKFALGLVTILEKHCFKYVYMQGKKISDGEAESLIYAIRMMIRTYPDEPVSEEIVSIFPNFVETREKTDESFIY